jgi:flagellar hook-associated protein 2
MAISAVNTQLEPFFLNLVTSTLAVESQPLERLTVQRDTLSLQRSVYNDLTAKLKDLQAAVQALTTTSPFTALTLGNQAAVTSGSAGSTVLTATAGSAASPGTYEITVTKLALAQRRASAAQSSADQALGKAGTFWLGGSGSAAAAVTPNTTVTGAAAGSVASGLRELAAGSYTVETRNNGGSLEFRLKDADGQIVAVDNQDLDDDSLTTTWQTIQAGTFDSRRGLTLTFSGSAADAATTVSYTAAGVGVAVAATDSLLTIAANLNAATQPEGREVSASVVGQQLVLTAARTGLNHTLIYADQTSTGGLGFTSADLQEARNAEFKVNNLSFTRAGNTDIADVIAGVTFSLAADAEGRSATIAVKRDPAGPRTAVETFVSKFNSLQTYLAEQTQVSVSTASGQTTVTRGALSGDTVFNDLRQNMLTLLMSEVSNTGSLRSLREIGLTLDDNLQVTVSDSAKLEAALSGNFANTTALLSAVMTQIDTQLSGFTQSSTGLLDQTLASMNSQITEADSQIQDWNIRLADREQSLIDQFGMLQAQIMSMAYAQQQWSSIYGSFGRYG